MGMIFRNLALVLSCAAGLSGCEEFAAVADATIQANTAASAQAAMLAYQPLPNEHQGGGGHHHEEGHEAR